MKFVWIALAIGAIVLISKMRKGGEKTTKPGKRPEPTPPVKPLPPKEKKVWVPAEIVFADNIDRFKPLLSGVSNSAIINKKDWTSLVVSINNDELTSMWESAINKPELWITYLQTFGLQIDLLDSFEALEEYKEMYETSDGTPLQIGATYKVVSNCWIYTDENNQKSVALKGVVILKV